MTRLFVVRHGQTDWNLERRIQGLTDIPLNDTGRAQAERAAEVLRDVPLVAAYASPLGRARETARIIAARHGLDEVGVIEGITEKFHGEGEGLTGAEIAERFGAYDAVPGMESRRSVIDRAVPALVELAGRHPGADVLVVSHGGVIGNLIRHASGFTLPAPGEVIANGSVHEFVVRDGDLVLDRYTPVTEDADLVVS